MCTRLGSTLRALVLILLAGVLNAARAAQCLAADGACTCPATGVTAQCETVAATAIDPGICVKGGGGGGGAPDLSFTCDLDRHGGAGGGDIVLIYNTSTGDFEASGTDANSNAFCCTIVGNPWPGSMAVKLIKTEIQGTTTGDTNIAHTYVDSASTEHNLINPQNWLTTHALVYGNEGNDTILGSNLGGNAYHEWLNGDENSDTIYGNGGWDHINGGGAVDYLYGGDGVPDTITGGSGGDYIWGGDETCTVGVPCTGDGIDGGPGDDTVWGGAGNDEIHGGGENDCIDGGSEDDTIFGELDDDTIIGGSGEDDVSGGAGDDTAHMDDGESDTADGGPQWDEYDDDTSDPAFTNFDDGPMTVPTECEEP